MSERKPHTIETATGGAFDYFAPVVTVADVAAGLSKACRFANQSDRFLSVAEHSILVCRMVEEMDRTLALAALFHDGHEAYVGDMPTPLKAIVGGEYTKMAAHIDEAVAEAIGLEDVSSFRHPIVKAADDLAVQFEASQVKSGPGWAYTRLMRHTQAAKAMPHELGWPPERAEAEFLAEYERLKQSDTSPA